MQSSKCLRSENHNLVFAHSWSDYYFLFPWTRYKVDVLAPISKKAGWKHCVYIEVSRHMKNQIIVALNFIYAVVNARELFHICLLPPTYQLASENWMEKSVHAS